MKCAQIHSQGSISLCFALLVPPTGHSLNWWQYGRCQAHTALSPLSTASLRSGFISAKRWRRRFEVGNCLVCGRGQWDIRCRGVACMSTLLLAIRLLLQRLFCLRGFASGEHDAVLK